MSYQLRLSGLQAPRYAFVTHAEPVSRVTPIFLAALFHVLHMIQTSGILKIVRPFSIFHFFSLSRQACEAHCSTSHRFTPTDNKTPPLFRAGVSSIAVTSDHCYTNYGKNLIGLTAFPLTLTVQ